MLNRAVQPGYSLPSKLEIPTPNKYFTSDGREVLWLNIGTQNIVRITLQFPAGTKYQTKSLQASSTIGLMPEGTQNYSAQEIAEKLDFYGSHIDYSIDRDHSVISAFCLDKYLDQTLEVLREIILTPLYSQDEFVTYCQKRKNSLGIEKKKVMYVAREQQIAALYGSNHPYGSYADGHHYDELSSADLVTFHKEQYLNKGALVFISGLVDVKIVEKIVGQLDTVVRSNKLDENVLDLSNLPTPNDIYIQKDDAVQSALRVGRVLFPRTHPDFSGMTVLNTVLGGYFGSRLMNNIREEKGYTYGIYSSLVPMQESGYLAISTEVGCAVTDATLLEIRKEMELLRTQKVDTAELSLVVNYLVGEMLRMLDGPFGIVDAILDLYQAGLPIDFIAEHFDKVKNITSDELLLLAQRYLNPADYSEVVVGMRG